MFTYRAKPKQSVAGFNSATLGISVGQEYHEGDKFGAAIELANARFSRVVVAVSDASQRYKLAINAGLSLEEADRLSVAAGAMWLVRHADIIAHYKPEITRWNDWRFRTECVILQEEYRIAYESSLVFKDAVDADIARFLSKKTPAVSQEDAAALCRQFLFEELAVHTLQARAYGGVRLYPGSQLRSKAIIRDGLVPEAPADLGKQGFRSIRLERRPILLIPGNKAVA